MENTEVSLTTTTTLPISGIHDQQHRFPTHDDHLQLIIAHQIDSPDQEIIGTLNANNSAEEDPNPNNPQFIVPIIENFLESASTGDEFEEPRSLSDQLAFSNGRQDDPGLAGRNERLTAIIRSSRRRIHDVAKLQIRYYAAGLGVVYLSHAGLLPIPFVIFSSVALGMAYLVFNILSCMTTTDEDSEINSSVDGLYRILKGVYYILSGLALISILSGLVYHFNS